MPLRVDGSGAFDLPGRYQEARAAGSDDYPAQFQGQVTGTRLTLRATWPAAGGVQIRGPFTATRGQEPTLPGGCPRCQDPGDRLGLRPGPVPPIAAP